MDVKNTTKVFSSVCSARNATKPSREIYDSKCNKIDHATLSGQEIPKNCDNG